MMLRLKAHLISGGRFYKAGLYPAGELPEGFGEEIEPEDEPVHSGKLEAPRIDSKRSGARKVESSLPRKIHVSGSIGEEGDEHEETRTAWRKGKLVRKTK